MSKIQQVIDIKDPSGNGMFSKVGRFSSEMHPVFARKDDILFGKRKFLKVSDYPSFGVSQLIL